MDDRSHGKYIEVMGRGDNVHAKPKTNIAILVCPMRLPENM